MGDENENGDCAFQLVFRCKCNFSVEKSLQCLALSELSKLRYMGEGIRQEESTCWLDLVSSLMDVLSQTRK